MERVVETHDPRLGTPWSSGFSPVAAALADLARDIERDFVGLGDRVDEKDFGAGRRQGGRSGRKAETAVLLREAINNAVTSMLVVAGPVTSHRQAREKSGLGGTSATPGSA